MMRLIELEADEWENIPLDYKFENSSLVIELVADRLIDFGVLDDASLKAFERDKPFERVIWFERSKGPEEFVVRIPSMSLKKYWLVIWNANSNKVAHVCYRFAEPIKP